MAVKIRLLIALFCCYCANVLAAAPSIGPDVQTLLALKSKATPFADKGAVLLSRLNEIEVTGQRLEKARYYRAIYLTNEEAVSDYSKLVTTFNAYYHDSTIDFARVITANGEVFDMQQDAISETAANSDDYLDDMKRIEFAVPQLKVGNIIEYQFSEVQTKPIIDGEWFSVLGFRYVKFLPQKNWLRIDPMLTSKVTLTVPTDMPLTLKNRNNTLQPEITQQGKTTEYRWEMNNLDAITMQSGMPPVDNMVPAIYVSTMDNWQAIDRWYSHLFDPALAGIGEADSHVKALADSLFAGLTQEQDKVRAVFEYIQKNVRYIGAHVNRGGYQPHTASEVLQNAYGDCKDQTTLIVALLRLGGIEAYPALVNTYNGTQLFDELATLNFNHMITYVASDAGGYWLDTSGTTGAFPGLSAVLADQQTFVVDGKGGELITIPAIQPEDNVATVAIDYRLEGQSLNSTVTMSFAGQVETNLRNYYQFSPEKRGVADQLLSPFVHDNRVTTFSATDPADIATPFVLTGEFKDLLTITDDIQRFHYSLQNAQLLKVFTGFSAMEPPAERYQSLYIQIPITVKIISTYPSPWDDAKLSYQGQAKNFQNRFFEIIHSAETSDNKVVSSATFVLNAQTISVEQYADLYKDITAFQKDSESLYIFERTASDTETPEVLSLEEQIAQARTLLDNGKFAEALAYTEALAEANEENGEVQFLLGIAQGFNGNDALSESAFKRAEALGYQY
ncbi:DUF3857 domain-containing protein [Alteromonas lipolytica]|uniref:DUF3857 domain-containing protein n=1 Tax=Alteromonas lipolytica TaxID=1856405 RepID=A0A1E8FHS4_9ALTE|nr:DUF3857 domain-containing protein [Alteromonas lipolytica]OFI35497.1 hypothetical protein BFC17_12075 [Alteromonas lipolytica]GGF76758.1 hypothetical protein GCM10011338_31170 [Alteromonas lipolytica]